MFLALNALDPSIVAADVLTRSHVLGTLHLLRRLAEASAQRTLAGAGLAGASDPTRATVEDEVRGHYGELSILMNGLEYPTTSRIGSRHARGWLQSLSLGELPDGFVNFEKLYYEGMGPKVSGVDLGNGVRLERADDADGNASAVGVNAYLNKLGDMLNFALALGIRQNASHPSAPGARKIVEEGSVQTAGGVVTIWDFTPKICARYIDWMRRASARLDLPALRVLHSFVSARTAEHIAHGRNLASALVKGIETMSPEAIMATHGAAAGSARAGTRAEGREGQDGRSGRAGVAETRAGARPGQRTTAARTGPRDGLCDKYQSGACYLGSSCKYEHMCRRCGRASHGAGSCAEDVRRRSRSPERRRDANRRGERRDEGHRDEDRERRRGDDRGGRRR